MTSPSILIFGDESTDVSLRYVAKHVEAKSNAEIEIVSTFRFCDRPFSWHQTQDKLAHLKVMSGKELFLRKYNVVWNRRFNDPKIPSDIMPDHVPFVEENWLSVIGFFKIERHQTWINDPECQSSAVNKMYQLSKAIGYKGFTIPDTLVTNDSLEAKAFFDKHNKNVICKTLSSRRSVKSPATVALTDDLIAGLDLLSSCPAIFQECIPSFRDIRVTIVGDRLFSAELDTSKGRDSVDWRLDANNPWRVHKLDSQVEESCRRIISDLGLKYAAIDLRITPNGEYKFFEINPSGQFLFIEAWTELPISESIADLLLYCAADSS